MKNYLEYKGFRGSVEYSQDDHCLYGEVLGLPDGLVLYEGQSIHELEEDFHGALEDYFSLRRESGESLDPPAYKESMCACAAKH